MALARVSASVHTDGADIGLQPPTVFFAWKPPNPKPPNPLLVLARTPLIMHPSPPPCCCWCCWAQQVLRGIRNTLNPDQGCVTAANRHPPMRPTEEGGRGRQGRGTGVL